jgi:hypothetical protein
MHWTKGAAAIWNNSCVWHAATVCIFIFIFLFEEANEADD